jgi:cytochrome c553
MIWRFLAACGACAALAAAAQGGVPKVVEGRCATCHGKQGESSSEEFPRLAAQNEAYLAKELREFKARKRESIMERFTRDLSDDDIVAIARFYAAQPAGAHPAADPELAAVGRFIFQRGNPYSGVPACKSCHGEDAKGNAQMPRLAGQHAAYLERQIREFTQRKRTNDNEIMHTVAERLAPLEVRAVSQYLSGLP